MPAIEPGASEMVVKHVGHSANEWYYADSIIIIAIVPRWFSG